MEKENGILLHGMEVIYTCRVHSNLFYFLFLGYRLSDRFIDLLMMKFDRTHTHRVNFDDFIQLCVVLQTLTAAFRDKDTDRDGVITIGYEEYLTMVFTSNI